MVKPMVEDNILEITIGGCADRKTEPLVRSIIFNIDGTDPKLINDPLYVEKGMLEIAADNDLHVVTSCFHKFKPYGVSGILVLAESDFSVHCWPERKFIQGSINVCHPGINIDKVARDTAKKFDADPDQVRMIRALSFTTNMEIDENFLET